MPGRLYFVLFSGLMCAQLYLAGSENQSVKEERHTAVSMRMIGHQVLLAVGDSTSVLQPIEKNGDQYRIRLGSRFAFDPQILNTTIDSVIAATAIAKSYIVEFVLCDSDRVVYSYEIGEFGETDLIPCLGRIQQMSCYDLLITILDSAPAKIEALGRADGGGGNLLGMDNNRLLVLLLLMVLALAGVIAVLLKRKSPDPGIDPNVVQIGEFLFNKRNMELLIENDRIGLTSKEADLLQLLSDSANDTVERDDILKNVWGDEGDYVGRTLDVFISKLRKKLQADSNVRIVNIRGIGYKLVLGN